MFNRTNAEGTFMSFVGTNVYFDAQPFYVSLDGAYDFESSQPEGWDGMIFVYCPSFDPSLPLKNWSYGDDGYVGDFTVIPGSSSGNDYGSRLGDISLKKATQYVAVTTSFYNYSEGDYLNGVGGGPGVVKLGTVPEPASTVPLLLILMTLRKRRTP
jgi:hypothetical protein